MDWIRYPFAETFWEVTPVYWRGLEKSNIFPVFPLYCRELSAQRIARRELNTLYSIFAYALPFTQKDSMLSQETGALAQFGLSEAEVSHALGRMKVRDVDYADLYFEYCQTDSVSMEE